MTLGRVMLVCVKRIERIRLYPTLHQAAGLERMLDVTRDLYNALLQQRRDACRLRGISVTACMQYAELTALRAQDPRVRAVYRECQDAVLHRLDLAMTAFFRRVKRGEAPGFPRLTGDELIASAIVATGARDLSGRGQLSQA
jgi:putative transposase